MTILPKKLLASKTSTETIILYTIVFLLLTFHNPIVTFGQTSTVNAQRLRIQTKPESQNQSFNNEITNKSNPSQTTSIYTETLKAFFFGKKQNEKSTLNFAFKRTNQFSKPLFSPQKQFNNVNREQLSYNNSHPKLSVISPPTRFSNNLKNPIDYQYQKILELNRYLDSHNDSHSVHLSNKLQDEMSHRPTISESEEPSSTLFITQDNFIPKNSNRIKQVNSEIPVSNQINHFSINSNNQTTAQLHQPKIEGIETPSLNKQATAKIPSNDVHVASNSYSFERDLPTRPHALKITERSFMSTEIVKLPALGSITTSPEKRMPHSRIQSKPVPLSPLSCASGKSLPQNASNVKTLRSKSQFIPKQDL